MKETMNQMWLKKLSLLCLVFLLGAWMKLYAQPCETKFDHYKNSKAVVFVNKSTMQIGINDYKWNFGDGSPVYHSNDYQVNHIYNSPGTYLVCLFDTTCTNYIFCDSVTVSATKGVIAKMGIEDFGNGVFYFMDSSLITNAPITDYLWDFGDGSYSHEKNAKHNYHASGEYHVSLTILDSNNNYDIAIDTLYATVTVPCYTDFNFEYINNQFQFQNLSSSPDSNVTYRWYFGDGSPVNTQKNPTHRFDTIGNYSVSLVMSGPTCSDSIQKVVYQPDTALCKIDFTATVNYQKVLFTVNSTIREPFFEKYIIEFGDFNMDVMMDSTISHIYLDTGEYKVCVYSQINLCGIQLKQCKTIRIDSITAICKAGFDLYSYEYTAGLYNASIAYGSNLPNNVRIKWGDGSTYNGVDSGLFVHTYANEGSYNVTLTINNAAGCSDSLTKVISVGPNYTLSGQIRHDSIPAFYAGVNIYSYDSLSGLLYYYTGTSTDENGNYMVKLKKGYYLVQADFVFDPFTTGYYLPTYYRNKLNWDLADVIFVGSDRTGIDIDLIPYTYDTSGNGNISGFVKYGSGVVDNNGPIPAGKPAEKMLVYLKDNTGKVIAYTHTHKDGSFKFENIGAGTYVVWGEMAGKQTMAPSIWMSNSNAEISGIKIIIGRNTLSTSVEKPTITQATPEYLIYPNPTQSKINLEWQNIRNQPKSIEVFDLTGQLVLTQEEFDEDIRTTLDLSELKMGLYILKINTESGQSIVKKLIKQD